MKIVDVNGKERKIISIKRMTQQMPDAANGGIAATKEYVEVEILGKTGRIWKEWYPLKKFEEMNPNIKVK